MTSRTTASTDPLDSSTVDQHPLNASVREPSANGSSNPQEFIPAAASSRTKLTPEDVTPDVTGIRRLMLNGSWRSVLKLCDKCLVGVKYPHDKLQLKLCKVLALIKMRNFKAALDELESVGDLDSKENTYENYPDLYPKMKGSLVPFSLRIIKAELPFFLKTSTGIAALDPLYELLTLCKKEISFLKASDKQHRSVVKPRAHIPDTFSQIPFPYTPMHNLFQSTVTVDDIFGGSVEDMLEQWIDRETRISFLIATHLVQEKEFPQAILLLQDVIQRNPNDSALLSCLGRVHLQLGNIKAASAIFKQVESILTDKSTLIHMNRGYLALSMDQYTSAIDHFQAVLDVDPSNIAASNNKAICLLYICELGKAISVLEDLIQKDPERNLNETVIFNLCTLYDLKSDNSAEKKRSIMNLVAKFGSDSFDLSVLKLNPV